LSPLAWLRSVCMKIFRGNALASEVLEELHAHIALRTEDLERQGLSRAEAERRARIEFGGVAKFRANRARRWALSLSMVSCRTYATPCVS